MPTPADIINRLHQVLTSRLITLSSFVTLALYRFDLSKGTLTYVNAGHTPGLIKRARAPHIETIFGENLPVGVLPLERYTETQLPVAPGDCLLLFSDGITDAQCLSGEDFGQHRLSKAFAEWPDHTAFQSETRLAHISEVFQHFTQGTQARDDQTALVVELCR